MPPRRCAGTYWNAWIDSGESRPGEVAALSLSGKIERVTRGMPWARRAVRGAAWLRRHAFMFVVGAVRGIEEDKVVFSSFESSAYNDSPRYISEAMHALDPKVKQVWLLRDGAYDTVSLPPYAIRAHAVGRDGIAHLATAKAWVDNVKKTNTHLLRWKKQVYFNTWHGDRGFKRVGKDNGKEKFERRLERHCAAMIAGSRFGADNYRTAFEFQGRVLMDGIPRNDILVRNDPAEAAALRAKMGFSANDRLMVFAPTYRDHQASAMRAELDIPRALDILEEITGARWKGILRLHYRSSGIDVGTRDPRLVDMCAYPEMTEILAVADLLISDYSSCAGDFILRGDRPAILYQSDIDRYRSGSRELYVDMDETPFFIAHDMDELEAILRGLTPESIRENCRQWREFFGVTETGHAAEASARFILRAMGRPPKEETTP